ncbi:hypothetical protein G6F64_014721 [Rhizopus arrhizus]|uniref:Uncharacterized protein n=1 Tax=Rhizopus oryzae TaxID=64495 RepID=A0A9P6WSW4_RHIOR|nr:hypothetical protein G6F64_014721 [Rhizopus arrhizus]
MAASPRARSPSWWPKARGGAAGGPAHRPRAGRGRQHVGRGRVAGQPPFGAVRWGHRPGRRGRRGALADGRAGAGIPARRLPPRQDAAGVGGRHHAGAGDQALHRNHHDPRHGARR